MLVQMLADTRLVVTSVNPVTGREEVEVVHEALIRSWPRLRVWLDEDRAVLRLREGVRRGAQEWEDHGRDESYLMHRGRRLDELAVLTSHPRITLNEQEHAYLAACRASDLQQRRLTFEAIIGFSPEEATLVVALSKPGSGHSAPIQGEMAMRLDAVRLEIDQLALRAVEHDGAAYGRQVSASLFGEFDASRGSCSRPRICTELGFPVAPALAD
jgi:hypothetical protein